MIMNLYITTLEFLSIYFISHILSSKSMKPMSIDLLFLAITVSFNTFVSVQPIFSFVLSQILCILYISQFTAKCWISGIYLSLITLLLIFTFQFISALLMIIILPKNIKISDDLSGIIGNIIALAIAVILLSFTNLKNTYKIIIRAKIVYKSLLLYSYIFLMLVLLYFKYNLLKLYDNYFIIIFVILLLTISNTCILYYDNEITRKNLELIYYNKNLPIYESLINDIRNNQHEFSNRIQNLELLPSTCATYDELVNALHKYSNIYNKPLRAYPLLKINMPLLAAALYNQALRAERSGILVTFDVVTSKINSQASEIELTDYANILLQNAIEACKSEDNIYVQITSIDGKTSIKIRNPIDRKLSINEMNKFFEYGFSTKHTKPKTDGISHGLGLHFLKKQLEKHNGYISVDCVEREKKYWICFIITI